MSRRAILGTPRGPVMGLRPTAARTFRDGLHIPSSHAIGSAFAAWKRSQPIGGSAYYCQAPTSPRNANPRNE